MRHSSFITELLRGAIAGSLRLMLILTLLLMPVHSWAQVQTYTCPGGFAVVPAPFIPLSSLKTVANPVLPNGPNGAIRTDLMDYIANQAVAIQLGKALFWDTQAGSDNKTACATCHFQAGADVRTMNQLNPGPNGSYDGKSANYQLGSTDFPFTIGKPPISDTDNIAGSQGVRATTFQGFGRSGQELTSTPTGFRQVTGKNTPSILNAVFNHRNFWNGRAQPDFNGVNPFGTRDISAKVWTINSTGNLVQVAISIPNASLASQAVGPPLNPVEMSASGRTFPDLGHKMLLVKPLGLQRVASTDSVLGGLADPTAGLTTTYTALIQTAFQSKWWNSNKKVSIGTGTYTMMEANFSLFWGLAIMMYESTLVSDNTPMDQYLDSGRANTTALTGVVNRLAAEGITGFTINDILNGLALFELPASPPPSFPVVNNASGTPASGVGCIGCHVGAETTSATVRNLIGPGVEVGDVALKNAGFDLRMERMFLKANWTPPGPISPTPQGADAITFDPNIYTVNVIDQIINGTPTAISPLNLPEATYDAGWYNIGVRPTADDPGLNGSDPFGNNLSWTRSLQALLDPSFVKVPGNGLPCNGAGSANFPNQILNPSGFPLLSGALTRTEPNDVDGTFKVSSLRNTEFNGPYFHNGGKSTLMQVMDLYASGGHFANATLAPAIVPLQLTTDQFRALVAFMISLTDERVRLQQAPFDHPAISVPNGADSAGNDIMLSIPAVGASGSATPLQRFLSLNPFTR